MPAVIIKDLGVQSYETTWHAMQTFTQNRLDDTPDEIWLVEHSPIFTFGQAGKPEHLLHSTDIPTIRTDRGGQITYHGPGQQIVYVLINLRRHHLNVRTLVNHLENTVINTLSDLNIESYARPDAPGVYINKQKICSLGLKIRKGCSFHGLALNVDMDLTPFKTINPCGYAGLTMTNVVDHHKGITTTDIKPLIIKNLTRLLDLKDTDWTMDAHP